MFIYKKKTSEKMKADKFKLALGEVLLEPVEDNEPQQKIYLFICYMLT